MSALCSACQKPITGRAYLGYCYECYQEIWGGKGEASAAAGTRHADLNERLAKPLFDETEALIRTMIEEFGTGSWCCAKCGAVRLASADNGDTDAIVRGLLEPCPVCKTRGSLEHLLPRDH